MHIVCFSLSVPHPLSFCFLRRKIEDRFLETDFQLSNFESSHVTAFKGGNSRKDFFDLNFHDDIKSVIK